LAAAVAAVLQFIIREPLAAAGSPPLPTSPRTSFVNCVAASAAAISRRQAVHGSTKQRNQRDNAFFEAGCGNLERRQQRFGRGFSLLQAAMDGRLPRAYAWLSGEHHKLVASSHPQNPVINLTFMDVQF